MTTVVTQKKACVVVLYKPDSAVIDIIYHNSPFFDLFVVVDNTEDDTNEDCFRLPNIIYLPQFKNIGLSAAFNIGISYLLEQGFEKAMLLDQDTTLVNDPTSYFSFAYSTSNDVAVIGPLYSTDRSKHKIVLSNSSKDIKFSMTSGCIYDLTIFKKLNGFDERMFLDSLDAEYCFRAKKNRYRVIRYNGYCVAHKPAITKTTKLFRIKYGFCAPVRVYYQNRNGYYCWHQYRDWIFVKGIFKRYIKIIFFFPQKKIYFQMMKKGKIDEKKGVFGMYEEAKA